MPGQSLRVASLRFTITVHRFHVAEVPLHPQLTEHGSSAFREITKSQLSVKSQKHLSLPAVLHQATYHMYHWKRLGQGIAA